MSERVLVCGGRDFARPDLLIPVLQWVARFVGIQVVMHGGATGADQIASDWCHHAGVVENVYEAYWAAQGKSAGPLRNQRMLEQGSPTVVIACPGGRGTADMVRRARARSVPVVGICDE